MATAIVTLSYPEKRNVLSDELSDTLLESALSMFIAPQRPVPLNR